MKVLKFGGSSVGSADRIKNVIKIILKAKKEGEPLAVVVSAFQGITDKLIETANLAANGKEAYKGALKEIEDKCLNIADELASDNNQNRISSELKEKFSKLKGALQGVFLIKELTPRVLDFIMSFGERISAYVISRAIKERGGQAEFLDAGELIKTDNNFGKAQVFTEESYENIKEYFKSHPEGIKIITGFIGSTASGETTTLGRGGSDFTASLFGAALDAEAIEIWTDVDGVLTADPRKVEKTFPVLNMTYEEAMEMSHFGAKVIYPPVIQPALKKNIPIIIKNTFNPDFCGTAIGKKTFKNGFLIKGISSISNITLVRVEGSGMIGVAGIAGRLFNLLAKEGINVILISQASSEHSICFAIDPKTASRAAQAIEKEFALEMLAGHIDKPAIEQDLSIIAVVGENMRQVPGVAGKIFQALGKNGVNVVAIAQGSSELNISIVVSAKDEAKSLSAIHDGLFLSAMKPLNIFLVGVGLIGGALLEQIKRQSPALKQEYAINANVIAIGDIDKMYFNRQGADLGEWKESLQKGEKADLALYVKQMKNLGLRNSVFADCTASEGITGFYEEMLSAGISIVTPNKKANSGKQEKYVKLKNLAKERGVKFFYEANVGAGLPVISTLRDLIKSGDKILKIEAILSGTLSYIFNNFKGDKKFSQVVREAKERGYTEPDPRDDLNGLDVARKILILARETGLEMELKDIDVQNIVPENCKNANNVSDFFVELEKADAQFEAQKKGAEESGKVLRYIARLEGGKARVSLEETGPEHPFYSLSGSDNIISFRTEHYNETSLVVKGPGAGAAVTAAGVLADILKTI